jgi:pyruvate dehydrogenase E1 component
MVFKGGPAWRTRLSEDLKGEKELKQFLVSYSDEQLSDLMANLVGHEMELLCEAFHNVQDDKPRCFVAYTVKGYGLPLAGHKDNHAGMITPDQMTQFQADNNIADGEQWLPHAGLSYSENQLNEFFDVVPYNQRTAPKSLQPVLAIDEFKTPVGNKSSTQVAFGKVMSQIAGSKAEFANRVVTTAPDVASSTNLSAWVNKRGVYHRIIKEDTFKDEQIPSTLKWLQSPKGQHIELGIAESNLFSLLSSLGQAEKHFGERLLPIGTVYDPFICRGLDALNYACYQDARFMLIGTPAGITLAPEGGAHQSFNTQLIGMAQPNLLSFEPAYSDEVACIMQWSLDHMQKPEGCSTYLRLSTRSIEQPKRELTPFLTDEIIQGAYWHQKPAENSVLAIVYIGVIAPEAKQAFEQLLEEMPGAGLLAVTSADKLYADWQ